MLHITNMEKYKIEPELESRNYAAMTKYIKLSLNKQKFNMLKAKNAHFKKNTLFKDNNKK